MNCIQRCIKRQLVAVATVLFFANSAHCGRVAYSRETTLSELRSIDGLVSNGLPVFNNGFFISTRNGPVLVKNQDAASQNKPKLNPGYYFTLPRVIPTGYEGIATTSFNLGSAIPAGTQPGNLNAPVAAASQTQQQSFQQPQQQLFQQQPQQQSFQQQPQQQSFQQQPQQQSFQQQPQQQSFHHQQSFSQPQQQSLQQPQQQLFQQPQQQLFQQPQQQLFQQPQQSVLNEQRAIFPQTQNEYPSGENGNNIPSAQSYTNIRQSHSLQPPYPLAQSSFQVDNVLSPGSDQQISALASQDQLGIGGPEKHAANEVVEQTIAFEESLPEELRNPFYRNANLASTLAQESLPTQGEQVVYNWDTNKIQKGRIHALLRGAGFI